MKLKIGQIAPLFSLKNTDDKTVNLKDYRNLNVVLYFYPKDDTPGCTLEATSFKENIDEYRKKDTMILGVSLDDETSHKKFVDKFGINFDLLCDTNAKVSIKYGVYVEKNMYGKKSMGITRTTFLIDKKGKIKNIWEKVKVQGHSKEILNAI